MSLASVQPPKFLSSFGRNRGRSLRPYQQGLMDTLLPTLAPDMAEILGIISGRDAGVPLPRGEATRLNERSEFSRSGEGALSQRVNHPHPDLQPIAEEAIGQIRPLPKGEVSPATSANTTYKAIALEIGFGGGEHLLAQAAHHPETLFIGCEPFINGVAKCLAGIDSQKLRNIRLYTNDARRLIETLPETCVDSVFILFPDPWPKIRHHKRRLVSLETLAMLARVHKPGGRLLLATDHVDYSVWMFEVLHQTPHYRWTAREQADWNTPPTDWTETKYQRKTSAEGRKPVFIECARV